MNALLVVGCVVALLVSWLVAWFVGYVCAWQDYRDRRHPFNEDRRGTP